LVTVRDEKHVWQALDGSTYLRATLADTASDPDRAAVAKCDAAVIYITAFNNYTVFTSN